ncbi:MFS transporter [Enemella sp. A6]|uniref:MFS transporter n=1 Tax=Enemella sp. A6 TaxID=3440152 RepID=UPI003EBA5DAA
MSNPHLIRIPESSRVFDRRKVLGVLLSFLAMSMMAVSSVNVALPAIESGLGATGGDLQWVLSGYALVFGITLVPAGRTGDAVGRGAFFMLGVVVFLLASLACGLAPTPMVLNIARLLQGVGAGIVNPQITGMIQQYFTGRSRGTAFGWFGLVISVSVAIGPVLTGALIALLGPENGWRASFLVNMPIGLIGLVLALRWFPFSQERRLWNSRSAGVPKFDLDPLGSVLLMLAVLSLMLPFMVHDRPWILLLLLVAPVLLFAWVRWERFYRDSGRAPMVDLALFSFRSFSNQVRIASVVFLAQPAVYVLLALYVQNGLGASALETALVGLSGAISSAMVSVWAGQQAHTHGRRLLPAAMLLMLGSALGSVLVVVLVERLGIGFGWLAVPLFFNGIGMGGFVAASQTLAMQDVPLEHGGTAGGVKQTAERIGTAIGIAVLTGVFFLAVDRWDWNRAFEIGFVLVALISLLAFAFAMLDRRQFSERAPR